MIKAIKKTTCALAVLAATSGAVMADSVDVRVIGSIQPSACKPSLAGGGTLDYGIITPQSLKTSDYTILDKKQVQLAITCSAPTKVALVSRTGRPGTALDAMLQSPQDIAYAPGDLGSAFGLGLANGKAIGGYNLFLNDVTADGTAVLTIRQHDDKTWGSVDGNLVHGSMQSWTTGGNQPVSFTTLSGTISAQAYINKASELDLSKPIQLDGLATLELVYL
ncbi:hypothetical protein DNK59_04055 [Pseudomonas sp. TKO26]|uniref:DUF1120 domain-containing protein n=1 Tax=unclassified Pseudomonas TaxID=196821 RepID=UPI000D8DC9DE|nr:MULTISPECIES: DUF1120 domain-containing protein [unclassified Pseudomonas]PYY90516.1 hypothetical protein DNK62_04055 [Pseudomonas sp. TKO30]PYY93388.1 hypothetical protein DNK61_04055 [Pseudomonas sp. TKO29]PYY95616.1 hypothetical protein DNK59_04055 [Pseudomonas sp. TKO26]PYZ01548.1 hypothetical protein DNK60_04055 [Pseudomonas sp. TKO14]